MPPVRTTTNQEPLPRSQFRRAIRVRVNRVVGKEVGYHFRHKIPVFVVANAMEGFSCDGGRQVGETLLMQKDILLIMTNPIVGSMDPEDENKLDSLWENVWRHHSRDEATISTAFRKIYNTPTPSQKKLIAKFIIQGAQELHELANDHVQEGLDVLRSLANTGEFSVAAVSLLLKEFDKPYLKHFHPTHQQGGTPNRDRILARTSESRYRVLHAINRTTTTTGHKEASVGTPPPRHKEEAEMQRLREQQQHQNQLDSLVMRLSAVEAKIADRNRKSLRSPDDDLALVIELSTVQEFITSHCRQHFPQPETPSLQPNPINRGLTYTVMSHICATHQ